MDFIMHNQITWLLVLDSTICRVYEYHIDKLHLVNELQHPENRLKDSEITSDKPGRYRALGGAAQGAFSQRTDPKEVQIEKYSKEIAKFLEYNNNIHSYKKLIIIASPPIHGLLLKELNEQVKKLIVHNVEKDLIHLTHQHLLKYIKDELKPH